MARTDVLVVSIGSTGGWRAAADELTASLGRAGASAAQVRAAPAPRVRTLALTDFVEARLARQAAIRGIAEHQPRALVYCSITAALLWPRAGAISLDSIAAENRPGRDGIWQRPTERRRLAAAPAVLTWSERSLAPLRGPHGPQVLAPPPVEGSPGPPGEPRDLAAVTYAGDPVKRRLAAVLDAWASGRRGDEQLVVTGVDGLPPAGAGVTNAGVLAPADFRALLRRARVFVAAPRIEDFGIAALEALAHGCMLVTTPSRGPYPAREIARRLDPRLVSDDLPAALRVALDDPLPGYAERAVELLAPYRREAVDRTIANEVLPRLLG